MEVAKPEPQLCTMEFTALMVLMETKKTSEMSALTTSLAPGPESLHICGVERLQGLTGRSVTSWIEYCRTIVARCT